MISTDVKSLMREIRDAKERIKAHIESRVKMLQKFAGDEYRGDTGQPKSPDNYPFAYKTFIKPQLLFGRPACTVTAALEITDAPVAQAIEVATNKWAKADAVKAVLDEAVDDCFFGYGVTKVCVAGDPDAPVDQFPYRTNRVEIEVIPPADVILDARAKRARDVRIIGHQFERDIDDVKLDPRYDPNVTATLPEMPQQDQKPEGDAFPTDEYSAERKRLRLYEIYLPERGRIMTIADKGGDDGIVLRDEAYRGPSLPLGPYDLWGMESVPGQLIPISPVQALWDEFEELNEHGRAAAESAGTHKKFGVYALAQAEDGKKVKECKNGDMVGVQDPASFQDHEIGGASDSQINWIMFLREKLDRNLGFGDAQKGIAADRTATGEQIAAGNSDMRIDSMRDRVASTTKSVFVKAAWYLYHDDTLSPMAVTTDNPMTGEPEEATFLAGPWDGGFVNNQFVPPQQEPDFIELNIDIEVRSMIKTDDALEQKRAQDEILLAQMLSGMGFPVNWRRVLDRYGSAFNVRDYSKIILLDLPMGMGLPPDPLAAPPGMAGQMLGAAPTTMPGMFANAGMGMGGAMQQPGGMTPPGRGIASGGKPANSSRRAAPALR